MTDKNTTSDNDMLRWILIAGLVVVAFFGAYKFASASSGRAAASQVAASATSPAAQSAANPAAANGQNAAGGGCCGGSGQPPANGVTGPQVDGTASKSGGIQVIAVKVTTVYSPNVIHLRAGVPAEITFSTAQGCTSQVQSQQLGFAEDLSSGPKVVTIKDPKQGTYNFECGMNMVYGKIVVE